MNWIIVLFFNWFFICTFHAGIVENNNQKSNNGIELIISNIKNKNGLLRIGVFS